MFTDPLAFLALSAYLVCIVSLTALSARLAALSVSAIVWDASHQAAANPLWQRLAALPALAAFFFLPLGSLPPFMPLSTGMIAFFALLCLSLLLLGAASSAVRGAARARAATAAGYGLLPLAAAYAAAAFFAHTHGAPGSPLNMGTLSAMPPWSMVESMARPIVNTPAWAGPAHAGVAVMVLGLLLCLGKAFPLTARAPFAWYALRLAAAHSFLALLLPPLVIHFAPDFNLPLLCLLEAGLRWLLAFLLAHYSALWPILTKWPVIRHSR